MKISFEDKRYPLTVPSKGTDRIFGPLEPHVAYTFSGKSAIARVLEYYRSKRVLPDKVSQMLVPEWLGTWVYMIIHNYCFPTTTMNRHVKGIMVYHQWGFPQKMEKILAFARRHHLFVLEDCAHSFRSSYKGKQVGTFGDASIWSFAKFFPSVAGGAVYSGNVKLLDGIQTSCARSDIALEKRVFDNLARVNKHPTITAIRDIARNYAIYSELFSCPRYAKRIVTKELADGALQKRKENFQMLKNAFWSKNEERLLKDSDVCPWVAPLFFGSKNKHVAATLQKCGIESGVYHFDINRNMLDPRFVECIAVPCHQGLSSAVIQSMIDFIEEAVQS